MREIAQQVVAYLLGHSILSIGLAFVAGFAAVKSVTSEAGGGIVGSLLIGGIGLFLSQFMLISTGLLHYIEPVAQFRILFDLIAAYVGAFVIAAMIHFVKPF
ncbi:MAG TPA: hypothetical protein VE131_14835 [Terriglobales bacterium]|nr:hypothetical protein [Terriglobales bacterium]